MEKSDLTAELNNAISQIDSALANRNKAENVYNNESKKHSSTTIRVV